MVETTKQAGRGRLTVVLAVGAALCAGLLLLLILPADKAEADIWRGGWNYYGPSSITEPAVACSYDSSYRYISVSGAHINAWARSQYPNGQYVGYQVRLFQNIPYVDGPNFRHIHTGSLKTALAYPSRKAAFADTIFKLPNNGYSNNYQVVVDFYWYYPSNGAQMGSAMRQASWYYNANSRQNQEWSCRI